MHFLIKKAWPVIAGLLAAFFIMMVCEFINSFFYPLPASLDVRNIQAVQAYTASLPWTAYLLVFFGWALGSFKAGCVTTYLSGEERYRLSFLVGIALTLLGIVNNAVIGHEMAFNVTALPSFLIFTYLGHKYVKGRKAHI